MRIFQVLEASANGLVRGNRTWFHNLYEPLIEMGHDVHLVPSQEARMALERGDRTFISHFSARLVDEFDRAHRQKSFDLIFMYVRDGMVDLGALDELRKAGVPMCNFSCNNAHQFELVRQVSAYFDYNLHAEKEVGDKFREAGANPLWWPMASNPTYFKPLAGAKRDIDVSFVGANYALRSEYVAFLLDNRIDIHTYGPGWPASCRGLNRATAKELLFTMQRYLHPQRQARQRAAKRAERGNLCRRLTRCFPMNMHGPVSDEEMIALYSRSHISLGFLEVFQSHDPVQPIIRHLHLREFEAPMCGALYCTGYSDELAEMFEPDREVVTYRTQEELLAKVRYYLQHPADAEKVRMAGRLRALKDHNYQKRFQELFDELGLPRGARPPMNIGQFKIKT